MLHLPLRGKSNKSIIMTTDFDSILNLTKRDFESKPTTVLYFVKEHQCINKLKSNDSMFAKKLKEIIDEGNFDEIVFNGEMNNIKKIKEVLEDLKSKK